jgi:di- and tripeptidase
VKVWSKETFRLKTTLEGHSGSILCLEYADDKKWLFSSSGDSTVWIWSTATLTPLYVLHPYLETEAGDLFSVVWSSALQTVYIGCQNTSIQWFDFRMLRGNASNYGPQMEGSSSPNLSRKAHKFWDSYPQYEHKPADIYANNGAGTPDSDGSNRADALYPSKTLLIPSTNVIDSAHYGYIYCMALLPSAREGSDDPPLQRADNIQLITGSGDEMVKVKRHFSVLNQELTQLYSYGIVLGPAQL